jgi:uncharacterized protein YndB with AHSA1/START domain/DNA-binding MarR family transcriptional regulator
MTRSIVSDIVIVLSGFPDLLTSSPYIRLDEYVKKGDDGVMDVQRMLAAIAEPTRFRIVQLLASAPRTVGEVASELGALQPQTTKHLQAMEAVGVVTIHRLGRRRVVSLRRDALEQLAGSLGALAATAPDAEVLSQYERAIAAEQTLAADAAAGDRVLRFSRDLAAPRPVVWRAWTQPEDVRRWWAPEHFEVVACEVEAAAEAPMRIVLAEADGARYAAAGRVVSALPDREFQFELSPLDGSGRPLFQAMHVLRLAGEGRTELTLEIRVSDVRTEAASAVAGLEFGWPQLLDRLSAVVA